MRLSLAWWNTSLSPLGNPRATDEQKAVALEVVRYLTKEVKVDCLALGEIIESDLDYFLTKLDLKDYALFDGAIKEGRLQFDTGAIYRKDSLMLCDTKSFIASRGSHSLKVANRLDFIAIDLDIPLHLFISHWPSRNWCERNSADRHALGMQLRAAVEELNEIYGAPANVILLGDYNDEPYDSSLAEQLLAVRDRGLVSKKPELLYNPFWRHLGETHPYIKGTTNNSFSGSCFHKNGLDTQWRTFDQIIFSSAFIGRSNIHLNEKFSQILQIHPFASSILKSKDIFDHFPVISVIEKEEQNA